MPSQPPPGAPQPSPAPAPVHPVAAVEPKQPFRLGIGGILIVATLALTAGFLIAKGTIESGDQDASVPPPNAVPSAATTHALTQLQAKAMDAEAKADLASAAEAMETCAFQNEGSYGVCGNEELGKVDAQIADLGQRLNVSTSSDTYTLSIRSATGHDFILKRLANGVTQKSCTSPGVGGCASNGSW